MAKTKTSKAPLKNTPDGTDQTSLNECRAILAFNRACTAEIVVNRESKTVSIKMIDELAHAVYTGTVTLQEDV